MLHPALRKLLGLRFRASLRRLTRGQKTWRGAVFSLIGLVTLVFLFGPQLAILVADPVRQSPGALREMLPLILFGYCLLTVLTSANRGGIHFTPAEVDLLFSAPFTRREMLLYKLASSLPSLLFATMIFSIFVLRYEIAWLAAFVGVFLALAGIQLLSMAILLVGQTVVDQAYMRLRKLALILLVIAITIGLGLFVPDNARQQSLDLVRQFRHSTAGACILAPFTVFSRAITAERVFPDLVEWGLLAAIIDLGLLGLVLRLDVNYLEAAVLASQKFYERIQRARQGRLGGASSTIAAWGLPRPPWLGGAGPIVHRQLITTLRSLRALILPLLILGGMLLPVLTRHSTVELVPAVLFPLVFASVFFSRMLPFDFRGDLDHFNWLKSLPLRPAALAFGQLVVPTLLMTTFHGLAFAAVGLWSSASGDLLLVLALFSVPFNAIVFALDNLVFLLFPVRLVASTPGDFQHVGRAMVEMLLKMVGLAICCGAAAGVGGLAYWLSAGTWSVFLVTAWTTLAALAAALVPWIAWAYDCFDVSMDMPP